MLAESQGLDRVLDALSAHTWPGLRLKARSGVEAGLAAAPSLNNCASDSCASDSPTQAEFSAFQSAPATENKGCSRPDDEEESAEAAVYQPLAASATEDDDLLPGGDGEYERLMRLLAGIVVLSLSTKMALKDCLVGSPPSM